MSTALHAITADGVERAAVTAGLAWVAALANRRRPRRPDPVDSPGARVELAPGHRDAAAETRHALQVVVAFGTGTLLGAHIAMRAATVRRWS